MEKYPEYPEGSGIPVTDGHVFDEPRVRRVHPADMPDFYMVGLGDDRDESTESELEDTISRHPSGGPAEPDTSDDNPTADATLESVGGEDESAAVYCADCGQKLPCSHAGNGRTHGY